MSNWIKCSDQLPEKDVDVLVIGTRGQPWIASRPDWHWVGFDGVYRITHWQPLPAPPEE